MEMAMFPLERRQPSCQTNYFHFLKISMNNFIIKPNAFLVKFKRRKTTFVIFLSIATVRLVNWLHSHHINNYHWLSFFPCHCPVLFQFKLNDPIMLYDPPKNNVHWDLLYNLDIGIMTKISSFLLHAFVIYYEPPKNKKLDNTQGAKIEIKEP